MNAPLALTLAMRMPFAQIPTVATVVHVCLGIQGTATLVLILMNAPLVLTTVISTLPALTTKEVTFAPVMRATKEMKLRVAILMNVL